MRLFARSLTIERGGRTVIAGLSFDVAAGETLVLTGPNGAGKSTLIRTIAGLIVPISGALRLDGGDPEAGIGEQSHYVGHLNAVKPALTVGENAQFWAEWAGGDVTIHRALARFGLSALTKIPARYLSTGQCRRLGLARLLLAYRPLWLLDEPTVSLDAAGQRVLAEAIDEHTAGGGLVVAATHLDLGVTRTKPLDLAVAHEAAA